MLYGPDGIARLDQSVRHMSSADIKALCVGGTFLTSLDRLRLLDIEPYCLVCASVGRGGDLQTFVGPIRTEFFCAHAHGSASHQAPTDVEPLLLALGWGLRCMRCKERVEGDNAKTDHAFTVSCPCTRRELVNPLAVALAPTPTIGLGHT